MKFRSTGKGFVQDLLASFRSDDLVGLRSILAEFQHQMWFFDLPPRLYLVPDANCVLKDLDFMCRRRLNPVRSALEEVVDAGLVRLFAPFELERRFRIRRQWTGRGVTEGAFLTVARHEGVDSIPGAA